LLPCVEAASALCRFCVPRAISSTVGARARARAASLFILAQRGALAAL
jgi:hypothetical protein